MNTGHPKPTAPRTRRASNVTDDELAQALARGAVLTSTLAPGMLTRAAVIRRHGWTDAAVRRFLADGPDGYAHSMFATNTWVLLYRRSRVERIEASDEFVAWSTASLARRTRRPDAPTPERDALLRQVAAGRPMFRKRGTVWTVEGKGLVPGALQEVLRADGSRTAVRIAQVLDTDGDVVIATFSRHQS